jgi:hypothetical protein
MEDMALRQFPVRTLACLAANRAHAQKCTGPSRGAGKARVALEALQHGGRTDPLPEKLVRAGDREDEALHRWFRAEITATFGTGRPCAIPDGTRAGRSNSSRGVAPCASLGVLTNKAGMSFSFMGIMLATARSIKDSDCGLEARQYQ